MEQGTIVAWSRKIGEVIPIGESFCRLETDKAEVSFDNQDSELYLARILVQPGTVVKIGEPVCLTVDDPADVDCDEVKNWKPAGAAAPAAAAASKAAAPSTTSSPTHTTSANPTRTSGDRVFASPLARSLAKSLGVDLQGVVGTGGTVGRITKEDVEKAAANPRPTVAATPAPKAAVTETVAPKSVPAPSATAAPAGSLFTDAPVSGMRATIAKRLTQSKNVEVPHYYLMNECNAENMMATIKHLNTKSNGKFKISVNDYIIKCLARANSIVPQCNSHWHGDFIRHYQTVDVSVAVATPTGLITPIIKNAHAKGLAEISIEAKELAKKARDGALKPEEYLGGTATISNLGGMGIPNFTAIINQPHSMILACGGIVPKPEILANEEGEFEMTGKVIKTISFTASFDHRVVDGAIGAEWFKHFKDAIENPMSLLL
jgi:pyruvate dehydrogenase E2 component (dihydrolipoamide acetyltransferase)